MARDSGHRTQKSFRLFIYLGMLLLMPMSGMAENDTIPFVDCSAVSVEAGS